jgi:hypothetical protein
MYQRLDDCTSVVSVFDAAEGVSWTIAGTGEDMFCCLPAC